MVLTESITEHIKIQSDAFHAGILKGMDEARKIVRNHGMNMGMKPEDFSAPPPDKPDALEN